MRDKCRVWHGFCEEHMLECNEVGKCPREGSAVAAPNSVPAAPTQGPAVEPLLPAVHSVNAAAHSAQLPCLAVAAQEEQADLRGGMCEVCGERVAEPDDFVCMECISRMLVDME